MSWEQYFTAMLEEVTRDVEYKRYSKAHLADYYLQERTADLIKQQIEGINFQKRNIENDEGASAVVEPGR